MIGAKIKEYRIKAGLTQEDLGRLMDKPRATISRWESGTHEPKYSEAIQAMKILKVPDFAISDYSKDYEKEVKKLEQELFELLRENRELKKENEDLRSNLL